MARSARRGKKGFTLIEMSIVILIIGLIVSGVLGGQHLIRVAELRSVISDVERFKTAINNFEQIYTGLPGDLVNATTFWPSASNGDGNGRIESTEATDVWHQLRLSGLLPGGYTGAASLILDTTVPSSKLGGGAYWLIYRGTNGTGTTLYGRTGNHIMFGTINSGATAAEDAVISGEDALYIDRTLDDGNPALGKVITVENNYGNSGTICTDEATDHTATAAGTVSYILDTAPSCIMAFWLD